MNKIIVTRPSCDCDLFNNNALGILESGAFPDRSIISSLLSLYYLIYVIAKYLSKELYFLILAIYLIFS